MLFATTIKNKFQRESLVKLFLFVVEGTRGQFGYALAPADKVEKIQKAEPTFLETVTVPAGVTVAEGMTAIKASTAGLAAADAHVAEAAAAPATTPAAPAEKVEYKVETGIELPPSNRGGRTANSTYPFEALAAPVVAEGQKTVYASFLIPGKGKKTISSTVSAANKRFEAKGLKFTVRDMDGGARVFRIK